jgi:hypothetical protein
MLRRTVPPLDSSTAKVPPNAFKMQPIDAHSLPPLFSHRNENPDPDLTILEIRRRRQYPK